MANFLITTCVGLRTDGFDVSAHTHFPLTLRKSSIMTNQTAENKSQTTRSDVINLLKEDHKKVKSLFAEYEELHEKGSNAKKAKIVQQICTELTLHALTEEAIVYPVVRKAIHDEDLMDEADIEHAGAKGLIAELQAMDPDESHYHAKVTVLKEYIEHHVKEEEKNMFPQLKDSDVDRDELGQKVIDFKEEEKGKTKTSPSSQRKIRKKTVIQIRVPQAIPLKKKMIVTRLICRVSVTCCDLTTLIQ